MPETCIEATFYACKGERRAAVPGRRELGVRHEVAGGDKESGVKVESGAGKEGSPGTRSRLYPRSALCKTGGSAIESLQMH